MKRTISKQKVEGVAKRFPLRLKIVTGVRKDNNAGLGPRGRSPDVYGSSHQNIPNLGVNKIIYYKYMYIYYVNSIFEKFKNISR